MCVIPDGPAAEVHSHRHAQLPLSISLCGDNEHSQHRWPVTMPYRCRRPMPTIALAFQSGGSQMKHELQSVMDRMAIEGVLPARHRRMTKRDVERRRCVLAQCRMATEAGHWCPSRTRGRCCPWALAVDKSLDDWRAAHRFNDANLISRFDLTVKPVTARHAARSP